LDRKGDILPDPEGHSGFSVGFKRIEKLGLRKDCTVFVKLREKQLFV
jgi:hypothetical protein